MIDAPGIPGLNPGPFTLQGTNTYLIGTGSSKILLGAGVPEYKDLLRKALEQTHTTSITCVLLTHYHNDHVGGIDQVKQICKDLGSPCKIYKRWSPGEFDTMTDGITDGQEFRVEGDFAQSFAHPGHGSTVFESLIPFMDSLEKLKALEPTVIYPGHGPMTENAMEKINEYIQHRQDRETQILALVKMGHGTIRDIVAQIYQGYPDSVQAAAMESTRLHLDKLMSEGRIAFKEALHSYHILESNL